MDTGFAGNDFEGPSPRTGGSADTGASGFAGNDFVFDIISALGKLSASYYRQTELRLEELIQSF